MFRHNILKLNIFSLLVFATAFFVVSSVVVYAQDFIEPSDQAPANNVVDFITVSTETQGRIGQLRINAPIGDIPTSGDSTVDVYGNIYFQGDTTFGKLLGPTLFVNASRAPYSVSAGTTAANGKFTAVSSTSYGLYAESLWANAIFVNTKAAGTSESTSVKTVFGQTRQVAAGEKSTGVTGHATNPAGYGIYAEQLACDGTTFTCGLAGQFYGNVVVTGTIVADGRGVFKVWTLNDGGSTDSSTGVSMRTVDVVPDDFAGTLTYTYPNAIETGEGFIAMSVLVDGSVYNPTSTDLSVKLDANGQLVFTKTIDVTFEKIIVTLFYNQQLGVAITVNEDINDDGSQPDTANPYAALIGGDKVTTFISTLGGGGFEGAQFLWDLYKDTNGDGSPDTKCVATECGTVYQGPGVTTSFTPPTDYLNTDPITPDLNTRQVWLRASWTSDSTSYADQQIDLYRVSTTTTPPNGFVYINGSAFDFDATVECPYGSCPSVTWSLGSGYGGTENVSATGLYTPPSEIMSGDVWTGQVRATVIGVKPDLVQTFSFPLLPKISITATLNGANETSQGPWTSTLASPGSAHIGITCGNTLCLGGEHTMTLQAVAEGVAPTIAHNFNWSVGPFTLPLLAEKIQATDGSSQTNNTNQTIVYTSPSNSDMNDPLQKNRVVTATWRDSSGTTLSVQGVTVIMGRGTISRVYISREYNTSGTYSTYKIYGFLNNLSRRPYKVCESSDCATGAVQVIDWNQKLPISVTPTSCGSLRISGVTSGDPQTTSLSYTAAGSVCNQALYFFTYGDSRASSIVYLNSKAPIPTCTCKTGTEICCGAVDNGGTTLD